MTKMKEFSREELLDNFKERLEWLSDNYDMMSSVEETIKWQKVQNNLMSSILIYLQWYPSRTAFLGWLDSLENINQNIHDVFFNYWSPRICRSCNGTNMYVDGLGNYICRTCHPTGK